MTEKDLETMYSNIEKNKVKSIKQIVEHENILKQDVPIKETQTVKLIKVFRIVLRYHSTHGVVKKSYSVWQRQAFTDFQIFEYMLSKQNDLFMDAIIEESYRIEKI